MTELQPDEVERLRAVNADPASVLRAAMLIAVTLHGGGKLLTFGNGGSAADAQHVAAELVGRFELQRAALPAIALTTDTSALTAIANDFGFDQVFSRQLEGLGRRGDVVLAISTSGTSNNVLRAVGRARELGLRTVGMCGFAGCPLCQLVDVPLPVSVGTTARVQEAHLQIEHIICRVVEDVLFAHASAPFPPPGSVLDVGQLTIVRSAWAIAGRTVVWTNGCFDILHAGHLASLAAARSLGDLLVVGINSDASVTRLKGPGRPLVPASERAELLAALRPVDYVTVFEEDTPEAVLAELRPDIHVKGADYAGSDGKPIPERQLVESYGGRIEFLPLVRDRSTSRLVEAMREVGP